MPALGGRVYLKIGRGGYDGRGQARIGFDAPATEEAIADAWKSLGEKPAVAEQALDLECEISVMAARNPSGEVRSYPARAITTKIRFSPGACCLPASLPEIEARAETTGRVHHREAWH